MDISRVIVGPVVTEKSERLKAERTYTIRIAPRATKIDVKTALRRFYDVEVQSVRIMRTMPKMRAFGRGNVMVKRAPFKKAIVTLTKKSKPLDLASFSS